MIRNAERPRVAALLAVAAVLAAIALAAAGVMIGKASVDHDGPTAAQLQHETFAAAAAKRETASLSARNPSTIGSAPSRRDSSSNESAGSSHPLLDMRLVIPRGRAA